MARKQRRRTSRSRPRPPGQFQPPQQPQAQPGQPGQPATAAASPAAAPPRAAAPRVGGDQALVRAVEMSLAPAPKETRRAGGRIVLPDSGDAAIPLDRVPYFTTDLIRVAITGVVMIALLVLAALLVIPQVVK